MQKFLSFLGFDPGKHSVRVELLAGLTTFLTMSYILAVNPFILGETGMDKGALFSATVVAAAIATLVMAFYARLPFALATGMGLNAFFAYTLVITMGYTWQQALAAVLFEGIVFILLTLFRVREAIVNAIPINLRYAISVGIGLFIAYIGLKNGGIIVSSDATVTTLGPWTAASILAGAGILLGGILMSLRLRGALFYTIIIITLIGIPFGVTHIPEGFSLISLPHSMEPIALKMDFSRFMALDINYYVVVFTLLFMDLFDTLGTLIGASTSAGMVDKKTGKIHGLNRALMADAIGTTAGALCGTSTVTTFVESASGVEAGGRTGLTSFIAALAFLACMFIAPIAAIIPPAATSSALIYVGILMLQGLSRIDFNDLDQVAPVFIMLIAMPVSGSIGHGIGLAMILYTLVKVLSGKGREVSALTYVISLLFLIKFFWVV